MANLAKMEQMGVKMPKPANKWNGLMSFNVFLSKNSKYLIRQKSLQWLQKRNGINGKSNSLAELEKLLE